MKTKKEHDVYGNMTSKTYYDSEGNVVEFYKYIYDVKGNLRYYYNYTYDVKGNLISSTWHESSGSLISKTRYDSEDSEDNEI